CHELLELHFTGALVIPTAAVAVPESKAGFETSGVLPMPCSDCEQLELPVGTTWWFTPPILVALQDGVIVCVDSEIEDVEYPDCLFDGG
ncbi:MAG: hypothetical protein L0271_06885, partial [Gemmatimonadetes bacterium]|nr:hypothetical protein [Gemmatimonadota bacterium]